MTQSAHAPFDSLAAKYEKVADSWESVYARIRERVTPLITGKTVLDIGNGGFFPYDVTLAKKVTALDISREMLDRIQQPSVEKIVGDARDLNGIADESQDVILFFLSVHHINGKNVEETFRTLESMLAACRRKLKPGGKLVIAEPTLNTFLSATERALFGLTRFILEAKKVGMIFFYHPDNLAQAMAKVFEKPVSSVETHYLPIEGYVDPLGGSFPGILKIPGWLCPTRYFLFIVSKP